MSEWNNDSKNRNSWDHLSTTGPKLFPKPPEPDKPPETLSTHQNFIFTNCPLFSHDVMLHSRNLRLEDNDLVTTHNVLDFNQNDFNADPDTINQHFGNSVFDIDHLNSEFNLLFDCLDPPTLLNPLESGSDSTNNFPLQNMGPFQQDLNLKTNGGSLGDLLGSHIGNRANQEESGVGGEDLKFQQNKQPIRRTNLKDLIDTRNRAGKNSQAGTTDTEKFFIFNDSRKTENRNLEKPLSRNLELMAPNSKTGTGLLAKIRRQIPLKDDPEEPNSDFPTEIIFSDEQTRKSMRKKKRKKRKNKKRKNKKSFSKKSSKFGKRTHNKRIKNARMNLQNLKEFEKKYVTHFDIRKMIQKDLNQTGENYTYFI